ncbi:MAG: membrane-bound lytic murein transglycosylase MltF [Pseudomonadota bacterium]
MSTRSFTIRAPISAGPRSPLLHRALSAWLVALGLVIHLTGCGGEAEPDALERIQAEGELVVATRNASTTYYEGPLGPVGPEYSMARRFADRLGVDLRLEIHSSPDRILDAINNDEVHLAAAALTATERRRDRVDFAPPYQYTATLVVHAMGNGTHPETTADLTDGTIGVVAGSSHVETLNDLKANQHPELQWEERRDVEVEDMLVAVRDGEIDYTLVDANEFQLARRFFPNLRATLDLTGPQPLAWALPQDSDGSLATAVNEFFEDLKTNGILAQILDHHYTHLQEFDYVGTRAFMRHMEERLPRYEEHFIRGGRSNDLDWRLLAAIGYQESHWNAGAISPTGVRGIMMLTQPTAQFVGISRRTDPVQSIRGGSAYLRNLKDRLPESIENPDRTWMALAAYNIGLGHLRDARELTEQQGGNPDLWVDVRDVLPLLRQRAWHSQTRHGYARGDEAVNYVKNIRTYYDILLRTHNRDGTPTTLARAGD